MPVMRQGVLGKRPLACFDRVTTAEGKPFVGNITPGECLLSVFIDSGVNKRAQADNRAHNRTFFSCNPALFKHSFCFF